MRLRPSNQIYFSSYSLLISLLPRCSGVCDPTLWRLTLTARLVKVAACGRLIQQSNHLAGNVGRGVEYRGSVEVQSLQPRCVNDPGELQTSKVIQSAIQGNDGVVILAKNCWPILGCQVRGQRVAGAENSERFCVAKQATQTIKIGGSSDPADVSRRKGLDGLQISESGAQPSAKAIAFQINHGSVHRPA